MSIDLDKIEKVIKEHLMEQPYKAYCSECGVPMYPDIEIDSGLDMIMTITPCDCVTPDSV